MFLYEFTMSNNVCFYTFKFNYFQSVQFKLLNVCLTYVHFFMFRSKKIRGYNNFYFNCFALK